MLAFRTAQQRWFVGALTLCSGLALGSSVLSAQDRPTGLVIGGKLGAGIGAPLSESGASIAAELEVGYVLPPLDHAFELFASFGYAAPHVEGSASQPDPRLPGDGVLHYELEQQTGAVSLGVRYRLHLDSILTPYAAAGGRLYLLSTRVNGEAGGEPFGETQETSSAPGAFFALGAELGLGPGALLAEVQLGYGSVDTFVVRDTSAGLLSFMVGYRLMFPKEASARPDDDAYEADDVTAAREPVPEPGTTVEAPPPSVPAGDSAGAPDTIEDEAGREAPVAAATTPEPAAAAPEAAKAQVRGHVRGFSGTPLRATIRIQPLGIKAATDEHGYFEVEVPPGQYTVRLRSFGYVSQSRDVAVEENGVTVLNVELGKK